MNNTDPTSFESILAGVRKLRQQHGANDEEGAHSNQSNNDVTSEVSASAQHHISSPSKSRSSIIKNKVPVINAITRDSSLSNKNLQKDKNNSDDDQGTYRNQIKRGFEQVEGKAERIVSKTVLVNTTQKENPLLNHLKSTNWTYSSSKNGQKVYYDYLIRQRAVLFLTLTYHKLYTDYITRRMAPLSKNNNNILIFVVDDKNSEDTLREITKLCMFNGFTLLVAFSFEQSAKYIQYLNK